MHPIVLGAILISCCLCRGQLLWREFFTLCGATLPNFDRMAGNPICKQAGRCACPLASTQTRHTPLARPTAVCAALAALPTCCSMPGSSLPRLSVQLDYLALCAPPEQIPWVDDPERLKAWEESKTGYPW
jgi:hypothetical protein